jgi:hypothetical protein
MLDVFSDVMAISHAMSKKTIVMAVPAKTMIKVTTKVIKNIPPFISWSHEEDEDPL